MDAALLVNTVDLRCEYTASVIAAKAIADRAGVPTVPGLSDASEEGEDRDARLIAAAKDLTFPLLIKASAGGGGRGEHASSPIKEVWRSEPSYPLHVRRYKTGSVQW